MLSVFAVASCSVVLACSATQDLGGDGAGDGGGAGDGAAGAGDGGSDGDGGSTGPEGGTSLLEAGSDGGGAVGPGPKLVAGGQGFTCAITQAGAVKCWGSDFFGNLGDGQKLNNPVSMPTPVKNLTSGVVALSGRFRHTCALTSGGAVYCWGQSVSGETGTANDTSVPALVPGLGAGVAEIAAGEHHTCARMTTGAVKCWGTNLTHELGNDSVVGNSVTPVDTQITSGALALVAGTSHTCVLLASGVSCWGQDNNDQLGSAATTNTATPVAIPGTAGAVDISASDNSTCVLDATGAVKCWGAPLGPYNATAWTPAGLRSLMPGGYVHMCAITQSGALSCWGGNLDGELGDGTHNGTGPTGPAGISAVSAAAGQDFTCVRTIPYGMTCFGVNSDFQLGSTRATPDTYTPAPVAGF
jgi:alpha-tubulin suppressor-like RCC1 family protein